MPPAVKTDMTTELAEGGGSVISTDELVKQSFASLKAGALEISCAKLTRADERIDFVRAEVRRVGGTIGPDGSPHLTTLFYVVEDGQLAFWTYGASQKVVNLRRDPRISCLVEDGEDYFELRGVSIQGKARLVEEYDDIRTLGSQVATRMAGGADLGDFGDEIVEKQARKRVGIVVEPTRVVSWDHAKMSGPPGSGSG